MSVELDVSSDSIDSINDNSFNTSKIIYDSIENIH